MTWSEQQGKAVGLGDRKWEILLIDMRVQSWSHIMLMGALDITTQGILEMIDIGNRIELHTLTEIDLIMGEVETEILMEEQEIDVDGMMQMRITDTGEDEKIMNLILIETEWVMLIGIEILMTEDLEITNPIHTGEREIDQRVRVHMKKEKDMKNLGIVEVVVMIQEEEVRVETVN